MNRRFNSTGRIRIPRELLLIRVLEGPIGSPPSFTADLGALTGLELDPTARVVIEAYVKQSSMRFDFGTLGTMTTPPDRVMADIDRGGSVQFRIKVVDTTANPGRLLALADKVRPTDEDEKDGRKSILPIRWVDLGEEVWGLEVSIDESPRLLLNSRVPTLPQSIEADPVLRGAIFPMAVRGVLRVILEEEGLRGGDEEWVRDWEDFAETLLGEPLPERMDDSSSISEVIERVVVAFCERQKWVSAASEPAPIHGPDYE